jgi:hypothetical protein
MIKIILILPVFLFLLNCSENDPVEPDPPNRVMLVMKEEGFDTLNIERGIDAAPNPNSDINGIQLMWYEPEDKYLIEYYNIYRSDDQEGRKFYELIGSTENQLNLPDTTFIDTTQGLSTNSRHWYYVTAVTGDGVESMPSDTIYYELLEKAKNLVVNNDNKVSIRDSTITFKWTVKVDEIPPRGYYLRVDYIIGENFHPIVFFKDFIENEIDYDPPQIYTVAINNFKEPLTTQQYRWRIDCKGVDQYSGSESDWQFFTVSEQ